MEEKIYVFPTTDLQIVNVLMPIGYCLGVDIEKKKTIQSHLSYERTKFENEPNKNGNKIDFVEGENLSMNSIELPPRNTTFVKKSRKCKSNKQKKRIEAVSFAVRDYLMTMMISYLPCLLLLLDIIICRYCFVVTFTNNIFGVLSMPDRLCISMF